jgi:hypothetical protein
MKKKSIIGILLTAILLTSVGCSTVGAAGEVEESADLKPVIYLYPEEDGQEISVSLDYNGDITELIPEFNAENTWNVTATKDGTITFEGTEYDYLFWEGVPKYEYDFFTGYCIKGIETEAFLRIMLPRLGLNEAEMEEFLKFWLPDMEGNPYNMISFQDRAYKKGAKLTVTPEPDSMIRVFMAWYPSDNYVNICPQIIDTPARAGFTVVEWGGNKIK